MNAAGLVAQRIERLRPKEGVGGSSPSEAANNLNLKPKNMTPQEVSKPTDLRFS